MDHPFVSVIIPNYNHARFLKQRIDSILNQTYKYFEIIILDDHSNDNSANIIETYKDNPHVSNIVVNSKNSGSPFFQWQKGIKLAKGNIIWIAESDDICENTLLEKLICEFSSDKLCVIAFCKSLKIDIDGNIIGEEGLSSSFHMKGDYFLKKYLSRHNYIVNASSAIFKKDIIDKVDWTFTKYRGCGDWLLWIELCKYGNIAYCNSPMNYFRIHGSNTTMQQTYDGRNEIEGVQIYRYMREKKYINYKEELRARISHSYSISFGKQHNLYTNVTKKKLLKAWKANILIKLIIWIIHIIQEKSNLKIINR